MAKYRIKSKNFTIAVKHSKDNPLRKYIDDQIRNLYDDSLKLEDGGLTMHRDSVKGLSKYLFAASNGPYVGIESNLPSTYYEVYPGFLSDNENYLKTVSDEDRRSTKRILIAPSGGAIRTDAIMHPQLYRDFIDWHQKNKVSLYWIDEYKAEKIRSRFGVDSTDISFWLMSFAATFSPIKDKQSIILRIIRRSSKDFVRAKSYVEEIVREAQLLTLDASKLPILSSDVVERWEGYIGDPEFRRNGIGKVLFSELSKTGRILDAAAGSGYETILLSANGYDITSNEYDPMWNTILKSKIIAEKLPVEIYQYDWRELSKHLRSLYSGVISVGNSLCMVIGKSERQKSIDEFYKILKPGGKLIIDERNFDTILKNLRKGVRCYSKGLMYACTSMNAELVIEDDKQRLIRFNFFDNESKRDLGSTIVQAPSKDELKNMLVRAGFKSIKQISDLGNTKAKEASIYTYIATK